MKLKYWLMIHFFIVMLLPILALYVFYTSLDTLEQKQDFKDFLNMTSKQVQLEPLLNNAALYEKQPQENYQFLNKHTNPSLQISLYRYDGFQLYSSLRAQLGTFEVDTDQLYANLNNIQRNLRTYSVKKPVFKDGQIVGIYEITMGREEWLQGVQNRSVVTAILFICFFIVLYGCVVYLLHRKLNRPLTLLRTQMTAFANGEEYHRTYNKPKNEIGELMTHFEQMKTQIEAARNELQEQQQEKEFIVASLSHDLKTPLTVIRTYTEALQDNSELSKLERKEYKTILFNKLEYMKQMLDDLETYSALQSANKKMERVLVEGEEFFDMLLSGFEEPCLEKKIQLTITQKVDGSFMVDTQQMIRIIDNVMSNSIRHTEAGQNIWIGAISKGHTLPEWIFLPFYQEAEQWRHGGTAIFIQNSGKAIPEEKKTEVFQPFVQGEKARGFGGSSGLGLSIAKMLIEQHEGKIKLWSAEGYGTLVAFWLKESEEDLCTNELQ